MADKRTTPHERALEILWSFRGGSYSALVDLVRTNAEIRRLLDHIEQGIMADRQEIEPASRARVVIT